MNLKHILWILYLYKAESHCKKNKLVELKNLMSSEDFVDYKNTILDPAFSVLFELTGTLKYLRLFSPLIVPGFENGKRNYSMDKSDDPFVKLLLTFFTIEADVVQYTGYFSSLFYSSNKNVSYNESKIEFLANIFKTILITDCENKFDLKFDYTPFSMDGKCNELYESFKKESSLDIFNDPQFRLLFVSLIAFHELSESSNDYVCGYVDSVIYDLELSISSMERATHDSAVVNSVKSHINSLLFNMKQITNGESSCPDILDVLIETFDRNIAFPHLNINLPASNYKRAPVYFEERLVKCKKDSDFLNLQFRLHGKDPIYFLLLHLFSCFFYYPSHKDYCIDSGEQVYGQFASFYSENTSTINCSAEDVFENWINAISSLGLQESFTVQNPDSSKCEKSFVTTFSWNYGFYSLMRRILWIFQKSGFIYQLHQAYLGFRPILDENSLISNRAEVSEHMKKFFNILAKKASCTISSLEIINLNPFPFEKKKLDFAGFIKCKLSYANPNDYITFRLSFRKNKSRFIVTDICSDSLHRLSSFFNRISEHRLTLPYLLLKNYVLMINGAILVETNPHPVVENFLSIYMNGNNPEKRFVRKAQLTILKRLKSFMSNKTEKDKNHLRDVFQQIFYSFELHDNKGGCEVFRSFLSDRDLIDDCTLKNCFSFFLTNYSFDQALMFFYIKFFLNLPGRSNLLNKLSIKCHVDNSRGSASGKPTCALSFDIFSETYKFKLSFDKFDTFIHEFNSIIGNQNSLKSLSICIYGSNKTQKTLFHDCLIPILNRISSLSDFHLAIPSLKTNLLKSIVSALKQNKELLNLNVMESLSFGNINAVVKFLLEMLKLQEQLPMLSMGPVLLLLEEFGMLSILRKFN